MRRKWVHTVHELMFGMPAMVLPSEDFFAIVEDYRPQANLATELYWSSLKSHRRWRFWIIIATGILAGINVGAALASNTTNTSLAYLSPLLTALAALYAAGLTVAGTVENFINKREEATGFREVRELLLSRYREYRFKWLYYVEAYGKTPTACMNAGRLYSDLLYSDQELRQKIKQLTELKESRGGKSSTAGQH
jgi:hypothetical protein